MEALPQARGGQHARALLVHRADELHVLVLSHVSIGAGTVTDGRRRPYKPDVIRVERGDWTRASGMTLCEVCAVCYFDHAPVVGFEWLNRLCDGRLVKL